MANPNTPSVRTDLALEAKELLGRQHHGIKSSAFTRGTLSVDLVEVLTEDAARELKKPCGTYITVSLSPFGSAQQLNHSEIEAVASLIDDMLPKENPLTLVVGLGNQDITPDALGPKTVSQTLVTRHIVQSMQNQGLENLASVAAIAPGVLGQTGIETQEIILSLVRQISPSCVIAIDALASKSMKRLGSTVQISNTGISPGSGVFNKRRELSEHTLGVPVISIGVPTVVDAQTLASGILQKNGQTGAPVAFSGGETMMVTPREIDVIIKRASNILALCINKALQPNLQIEDISELTG